MNVTTHACLLLTVIRIDGSCAIMAPNRSIMVQDYNCFVQEHLAIGIAKKMQGRNDRQIFQVYFVFNAIDLTKFAQRPPRR